MDILQKLMEQELQKLPALLLKKILEKKLRGLRIKPTTALIDEIVKRVLAGDYSSFQWNDGKASKRKISLSLSDAEIKELDLLATKYTDSLPDFFSETTIDIAKSTLKDLKKRWVAEHSAQMSDMSKFRINLEKRWGKAIDKLRMLLTISRELGSELYVTRPSADSSLNDVLIRLHVRACQVMDEIITLLANGFADGAMARWRTLHEIGIVITLINEHGEPLAKRYLAHRVVESKVAKDQYMNCFEQLGYQPLTLNECQKIDSDFNNAIETYGKEFVGAYGWAEGYVTKNGSRRLGFGDLEAAAGRAALGSYYKLASYNVHAGPHALFFRLGLIDNDTLLAGSSNAGLLEPGQNAGDTFTLITIMFVGDHINMDTLVVMRILILLRNEVPAAFAKAHNKLQADYIKYSSWTTQ